jgi:RNA polymerase sigma factor (sigma-70 family)
MIENYGIEPPEDSRPFWRDDDLNENDIITSIDLKNSLAKLHAIEREIIILHAKGYTLEEIAEIIHRNENTVKTIKIRAIDKLKEMMT